MFEAIIYFDGPTARWNRREGHLPPDSEILARRTFRFEWMAKGWADGKSRALKNVATAVIPK